MLSIIDGPGIADDSNLRWHFVEKDHCDRLFFSKKKGAIGKSDFLNIHQSKKQNINAKMWKKCPYDDLMGFWGLSRGVLRNDPRNQSTRNGSDESLHQTHFLWLLRGVIQIANVYKIYCSDRYHYHSAQIRGTWKTCKSQSLRTMNNRKIFAY